MMLCPRRSERWDVIVVGAGPAGAVAALLLARQGRRVLLVDRARFPREKACGCCLGARGVRLCRDLELGDALINGVALNTVEFRQSQRCVSLGIPAGLALPRGSFDHALVKTAVAAGVTFIDACSAHLRQVNGERREVHLSREGGSETAHAPLVLACDGIHGRLLEAEAQCRWHIADDAWMGVAVTLSDASNQCTPNTICMHLGDGGYVGAVRLADGRLHLAAALDPKRSRETGGPAELMRRIVCEAGDWDIPDLVDARLLGTPLLTRRRDVFGAHRVLALGDSCTYIEPFTGEGMTWAIESAACLSRFLLASSEEWRDDMPTEWTRLHGRTLVREQSLCKAMRWVLHRPKLCPVAMEVADAFPAIADGTVARLSGSVKEARV